MTGIVIIRVYHKGLLHGKSIAFNKNGKRKWQCNFTKGILNGKREVFNGNGELLFWGIYRNGLPLTGVFGAGPIIAQGDFIEFPHLSGFEYENSDMDMFIDNELSYYFNNNKVTRQKYLAARAKDPTLPKPPEEDVKESATNKTEAFNKQPAESQ